MSDEPVGDYGREVRETVVKSTLTGVGLTVLAVAALSPAGFGGMIGTSVASALGGDHSTPGAADPYAKLPPFPSLLTQSEISDIHGQLAATTAAMEITRAATEDRIEFVHNLALHPNALSVAPLAHFAKAQPVAAHETRSAEAISPATQVAPAAPVATASAAPAAAEPVAIAEPAVAVSAAAPLAPISFETAGRDRHLELATLLLGDS